MTLNISGLDYWELLENYTFKYQPSLLQNPEDNKMLYPPLLGEGYKENIWLNNGIKLTIHSYQLNQDLVIDNTQEEVNCIEFAFKLDSNCVINNDCLRFKKSSYVIGKCHKGAVIRYPKNTFNKGVDLHLDVSTLEQFLGNNFCLKSSHCLSKILSQESKDFSFSYPLKFSYAIEFVIQQIINCPYQGMVKSLYLEGKSLELIALYIDLLAKGDRPYFSQSSSFKKSDIEAIYQAKEILEKNFDNPPTLSELAKQVRLTNRKLEEGFRKTFNNSVFGYLRQHRLEISRQLLEDKEISISTISSLVGYASHSAFTHAFQKQFGVTPKAYQTADKY